MHDEDLFEKDGGLLKLLVPSMEGKKLLLIESLSYLPRLREMFPHAEITAVVADEWRIEAYKDVQDIQWELMDYREVRLPFQKHSMDYIMGDRLLETAQNPQDIASGFSMYLTPTGFFVTSCRNIRWWRVLRQLMDGHYYAIASRMFTRSEFENVLFASFYKETFFAPVKSPGPHDFVQGLIESGFDNAHDDLDTEYWMVRAAKSTSDIAALKACFTQDVRKKLSRILRRMEFGIEVEENGRLLRELMEKEHIFPDYAAGFLWSMTTHHAATMKNLYGVMDSGTWHEMIEALLDSDLRQQDRKELMELLTEVS